jgi:glycosyltransferase involved in cell wall biosynthesis
MTPAVSVIVPTYNRSALTVQAVRSVLDQTFQDFEVLVVDDGSTDDTRARLEDLAARDARVRPIFQPNRGRSRARNVAIDRAAGEFIAFLDSDDLFLPDKLRTHVALLRSDAGAAMVYTAARGIDSRGEFNGHLYPAPIEGDIYFSTVFFVPVTICLPTVVVRADVLRQAGGFDESMHRFEDVDLWRRITRNHRVRAIATPTVLVRTHDNNQMEHPDAVLAALDYYVHKVLREDHSRGERRLRTAAARLYRHYGYAVRKHPKWTGLHEPFFRRSLDYRLSPLLLEWALHRHVPRLHALCWNSAAFLARTLRRAAAQPRSLD